MSSADFALLPKDEADTNVSKPYPIGGPLWFNFFAMLIPHTFGGFVLTAMNRIPYMGESPTWYRAVALLSILGAGIASHLWSHIGMTPKVRNPLNNVCTAVATLNLVFFFTEVNHVLGLQVMIAAVVAMFGLVGGASAYYKKVTGKDMPVDIDDIANSLQTKEGVIFHGVADFGNLPIFVVLWYLANCPSLVAWMQ